MEEKNLVEKVEEMENLLLSDNKKGKKKVIKLIRKAKVRKSKLKKGYIGILKISENGNISGEKVKINNFVYRLNEGNYHSTDGREKIWWNGRFPIFIQQTWKLNPINFFIKDGEKNETYGQSYVMARMIKDAIIMKAKSKGAIMWVILIIAAFVAYKIFTGGI
ncbi:MAG TPA: hypothetical protein ENH46_04905 [Candidatus Pacearchaeota archaeon]|nr:hypothetical protein [Candidatus Pacearchaeota archaeon]